MLVDDSWSENFDDETEISIRTIQETAAVDISEVVGATEKDEEMQAIKLAVMEENWTSELLKPYAAFRHELSFVNGLIMRGTKLVIPSVLRSRMLVLAHEGHPGQTIMKRRLRDRCWWPKMDICVSKTCDSCEGCFLPDNET